MPNISSKLDYTSRPSPFWYWIERRFFDLAFHTLWPLRISGAKNVPRKGAAIVVCNHLSMVDPFLVAYGVRRVICFMAKEELFRNPVTGFLVRVTGAFPVDRSRMDAATMRTAMTVLKDGYLLGMFPEGTRSTTGDMQEFRTGAIRLAARTRTPIIPTAVYNTDSALPPGKFVRPASIRLAFGPPIEFTELYDRNDRGEPLERAIATLRERIQALHDEAG
jgi:1-acyl-sn-glycerol-3-phosphate acyltransferase